MDNYSISNEFKLLGKLMELHGENSFKIKSYVNASRTIKNLDQELSTLSEEDISNIKGIGKAIQGKIQELLQNGFIENIKKYEAKTPPGIVEMLQIRGFGAKKIAQVWQQLQIESAGELLYACYENRLAGLKGFGEKTQAELITKLNLLIQSRGKYLLHQVVGVVKIIEDNFEEAFESKKLQWVGDWAQQKPIVEEIVLLSKVSLNEIASTLKVEVRNATSEKASILIDEIPIHIISFDNENAILQPLSLTSEKIFVDELVKEYPISGSFSSEEEYFESHNLPNIAKNCRTKYWTPFSVEKYNNRIKSEDIKGVVHSHSVWSDGQATVKDMALHTEKLGYEYLVMTDHSQTASYANGLKPDRIFAQWEEIEKLNSQKETIPVLKGIESDILMNGDLDYSHEILKQFDVVVASIHSQLKMDKGTATNRIIKAVENPYTHILGHLTGRLLLSRLGYELDFEKVIDACAKNNVAIELNTNPNRLDIDYTYISQLQDKGVKLSINPDAHSLSGIENIKWGISLAQRGGLLKENCLNAYSKEDFLGLINK